MVNERASADRALRSARLNSERGAEIRAAMQSLQIDAVTVEVVRELERGRVRSLLLKGPSIAGWLYDRGESRPYLDADLLVDPAELEAAARVLRRLGFERSTDQIVAESFAEPHAVTWLRYRDRVAVDLHWRLPGVRAEPPAAWRRLSRQTEPISVGHAELEALTEDGRALHLALHAIHDGREADQSMSDLVRGLERLDDATWRSAAQLAEELDAVTAFSAGLRLTAEGAALADRLSLPDRLPERWILWGQTPPPGALRLHELATVPGVGAKARFLASTLLPPPSVIRGLYPEARDGTGALLLAYLRRGAAGIRNAPSAIRAVRRARGDSVEERTRGPARSPQR